MKRVVSLFNFMLCLTLCSSLHAGPSHPRCVEDFNQNWRFHLGDEADAAAVEFDDSGWRLLDVPHDWSIEAGYQQPGATAASTGFVPGGIGWYRKSFTLSPEDAGQSISILFDGIYNNSSVWINGHFLGFRPYGYSSFSYNVTDYVRFDQENVLAVKVDRTAYADSRWYTGSGIFRKVRLIKTAPLHVAQWGVRIMTPKVSREKATVAVWSFLEHEGGDPVHDVSIDYRILAADGRTVVQQRTELADDNWQQSKIYLPVEKPKLWSTDDPVLYTLVVEVFEKGALMDRVEERFGIRSIDFDADKGFFLNGAPTKLKGVNLHHDAGAVGAAVPKDIWRYRVRKLKSIGANAIRTSHNPPSVELLEVCDELGMLVIDEAFDEWNRPKGKGIFVSGDGKGSPEAVKSYPVYFDEWAERDLKTMVRRDFNHPSIIIWSIGNEIEWTFPYYAKTYADVNGADRKYYEYKPVYDSLTIRTALDKNTGGVDTLVTIAKKLSAWIKEIDTSRPVTCGNVHPSIGLASGYADQVDVLGFNYRAVEYDSAHLHYPDLKIYGSENWGTWSEWKNCIERDFVAGIFVWTGFAYLGEAGPWPRKGLDISFFDFAGFKTPRGHFFECLWKDTPKIYMVTTPAAESEYAYDEKEGWSFTMKMTPPPAWNMLRLWEWYKVYPKWRYPEGEPIIVQAYSNCEEAELFLNDTSLGRQKRANFGDDNIIKWMLPYAPGELRVVGYNDGAKAAEYRLTTPGPLAKVEIETDRTTLPADGKAVAVLTVALRDERGVLIADDDRDIVFEIDGGVRNIGVDNGWEYNVQPHKSNRVRTHQGRAVLFLQAGRRPSTVSVTATCGGLQSEAVTLQVE